MRQLSSSGQDAVNSIAQRHGFSLDATLSMLNSVLNGNGSMAQFNHPEFAGAGQWMRGGMTMVSDMFNQQLSSRVANLCAELSDLLASQPDLLRSGNFQSQSQGSTGPGIGLFDSGQQQSSHGGGFASQQAQGSGGFGAASLFVPGTSNDWWPADLRHPNSTGAQNGVRYAYFAQARRLVIDLGGTVTVYDTLDHQIGGFSQQQSVGGTLGFTSQYGLVDVTSLPVISSNGQPPRSTQAGWAQAQPAYAAPSVPASGTSAQEQDIFATIEKLAGLHAKGILSNDEFQAKKAELLSRL